MARFVAPSLRALLSHLIDYAGMFPPSSLPAESAISRYECYRAHCCSWMLGRFVVSVGNVEALAEYPEWPLALLSDCDHPRAGAIESKKVISTGKPTYCEVPVEELGRVKAIGSFAKFRTGGVTPESIPSVDAVAEYIATCARMKLPFKATAGLHHPIRAPNPLTYEPFAPEAATHGFLNVFLAAAFAWSGVKSIEPILAEEDGGAFRFDDRAHWRDLSHTADQVETARTQFAHSFGSCSFSEPVQDLEALGWL
jgi:hypothetical protein